MLKIEVIKFEAQDVITASNAEPVEAQCICNADNWPPACRQDGSHEACVAAGFEGTHQCEMFS